MRKPKTFTWRERIQMMDSKTALQEAENSLQETQAKLREAEKLEENAAKQSQEEGKTRKHLMNSKERTSCRLRLRR